MQKLVYGILLIFVVSMGTACKDVCEKAADVAEKDCGLEVDDSGDDGDGEEVECEGVAEAAATCVVDNKNAYCDFIDDPTQTNDFTDCVADAL